MDTSIAVMRNGLLELAPSGSGAVRMIGPLHEVQCIAICNHDDFPKGRVEIEAVCRKAISDGTEFGLLVRYRRPPVVSFRVDPPVSSLVAQGAEPVRVILENLAGPSCPSVYSVIQTFLREPRAWKIAVIQISRDPCLPRLVPSSADWVMAHRGDCSHLADAIRYTAVAQSCDPGSKILVCLDEDLTDAHARILSAPGVAAYVAAVPGLGPYPLRNELMRVSAAEFVCFQDSDDIPCFNRVAHLRAAFTSDSIGMVGSHEIRVDSARRCVLPVRYPLDASGALPCGAHQTLLHPTSMVRKRAFVKAGGFSTHCRVALDTQFLLRSFFLFESKNVDEFLYIRRLHSASLTQSKDTGLNTLMRRKVARHWRDDFFKVLNGQLLLIDSSLAPVGATAPCRIDRVVHAEPAALNDV